MRLKERVAIITGGGTGIGRATALLFAAEGAKVVIAARRMSKLNDVVHEIEAAGGSAMAVQADIGDERQIKRIFEESIKAYNKIDILVNNSATGHAETEVAELKTEEFTKVVEVNLIGTMICCREALKHMIKQKSGSIVNISSVAGVYGHPTISGYGSSKAGIIGLTKTLAMEVGKYNIRVNSISPAGTETDMFGEFINAKSRELGISREEVLKRITDPYYSLRRIAQPEEQAKAILFMASDDASAVTGQNLIVDCGFHIVQPNEII